MPKEWHDKHTVNKMDDGEKKDFYRSIVADKKPYFMRYIYPSLMKQYNTYIKNTDRNSLREFQLTVDELKQIPLGKSTERQKDFLKYYDYRMPVGTNDCVMNRICHKFEEVFDGHIRKHNNRTKFDYTIMRSDAEYTPRQYNAIRKLYDEYNKRLKSYSIFADYERLDDYDTSAALLVMNEDFKKECDKVSPNSETLCNIMLDLCYNKSSTKRFVWSMCGTQIIHNLLTQNENKISFPVLDESGNINFGGYNFKIETKTIGVNE